VVISKHQVLQHFGSAAKAAEFFGITTQAVWQWPDGPIPELRALQLAQRLPSQFAIQAPLNIHECNDKAAA
jgi:hypothetical protein